MKITINSGISFVIGVVAVALLAVLKGTLICELPFATAAGIISGLTIAHMTKRIISK